jgi:hypothetical protein
MCVKIARTVLFLSKPVIWNQGKFDAAHAMKAYGGVEVELQSFLTSIFFSHGATAPSGPGWLQYRGFAITLRHTTVSRTPLDEWSARRRDLYLTTHNGETSMPPVGVEVTTSKRVAADTRLRPCGHWDRLLTILDGFEWLASRSGRFTPGSPP